MYVKLITSTPRQNTSPVSRGLGAESCVSRLDDIEYNVTYIIHSFLDGIDKLFFILIWMSNDSIK